MKTMTARLGFARPSTLAAALAILLACGSWSLAQTPKLAQQLLAAQQTHPDILAAEAKVRLAEAELEQVRFKVAQEIIAFQSELQTQREEVYRLSELFKAQEVDHGDLVQAKAKLAALEAKMPYLLGQQTPGIPRTGNPAKLGPGPKPLRGKVAEAVCTAIAKPTQMAFIDTPIGGIAEALTDHYKIAFIVDKNDPLIEPDMTVTIHLQGLPLGAAFQALEDTYPPLHFVIREYGILITSKNSAVARQGVSAVEYWRENLLTDDSKKVKPRP